MRSSLNIKEILSLKKDKSFFEKITTTNCKEKDPETGFNYFGARYYDSDLSIWLSVDPLADKYPGISPYVYCANNPIMFEDPDGREIDEWEVNQIGKIVNRIENKNVDMFRVVDDNGNELARYKEYAYGTIERQKTQSYARNGKRETYDSYRVRGDNNGTGMFEFLASHTNVEWSQAKLGIEGDKGLNYLTTSHLPNAEDGIGYLIVGQLQYGYTIREHIHSHPRNTPYLSGLSTGRMPGQGDIGFARWMRTVFGSNVMFKIYTPNNGQYYKFNINSKREDFPR